MKHLLLAFLLAPQFATAGPISFDGSWKEWTFRRYTPTDYSQQGAQLKATGKSTSSVLYKILPQDARDAKSTSWSWSAASSVPATKLDQEGGDDRNMAVYFVFTDEKTSAKIAPNSSPARMMGRRSNFLVYAWGDSRAPGTLIKNPYNKRGVIYLLRPAGTGSFSESRNLAADYKRAFGAAPGKLVGIAVAADGDDTESSLNSTLKNLRLD